MTHQLWLSPVTGYRRKGTRLSDLHSLFGTGITARTILEPLQSCLSNAPADEISEILHKREFDLAGVLHNGCDRVIGFIERTALVSGSVIDYVQPMTPEHLISDGTPLATLFTVLKDKNSVFVLIGSQVKGIVSRADLNKPPVRMYLFGLISLLEMHLSFWIKEKCIDAWQNRLSPARINKAREIKRLRHAHNEDIALLDCLQFCDKRELIVGNDAILSSLGLGEKPEARKLLKNAERLRDQIAHSQYDIRGTGWQDVIELVEKIESVVYRSDDLVEAMAAERSALYPNPLFES